MSNWRNTNRYNAKCGTCKTAVSISAERVRDLAVSTNMEIYRTPEGVIFHHHPHDRYRPVIPCPNCGRKLYGREVLGKNTENKKCGNLCRMAKGFQCDCSCGGKNHGAGNAIVFMGETT